MKFGALVSAASVGLCNATKHRAPVMTSMQYAYLLWSRKGEPFWTYRNVQGYQGITCPVVLKMGCPFPKASEGVCCQGTPEKNVINAKVRGFGAKPLRFCTTPRLFFQPKPRGPTQLGCPSFKMKLWPPRLEWCWSVFFSPQAFQKQACYTLESHPISNDEKTR